MDIRRMIAELIAERQRLNHAILEVLHRAATKPKGGKRRPRGRAVTPIDKHKY
jgi:hypothetical protein